MADRPEPATGRRLRHDVPTLLTVQDLRVSYRTQRGDVHAVDGASFKVMQAEMLGVVGESGCGKTTAARALTGVMAGNARITGGSIRFVGHDLLTLDRQERRSLQWKEIAFVPQSAMNSLDPVYRIEWLIREVLRRGGMTGRAAGQRAAALLEMVGLPRSVLTAFPHQLS